MQAGNNGANARTGFYFKKYNDMQIAGNYNLSHNNLNVLRYPEVLLIYAEAMYQLNGTLTQDQIDYTINKLRDRVGMHRMNLDELKAWNLDLWTEIKRERRIEMVLDGMRYADVMRWREGELRFGRLSRVRANGFASTTWEPIPIPIPVSMSSATLSTRNRVPRVVPAISTRPCTTCGRYLMPSASRTRCLDRIPVGPNNNRLFTHSHNVS